MDVKAWVAQVPDVDAVRPAVCPCCGGPGQPTGERLTLVGIFERAIDAIWRAHGDSMAELQSLRAADNGSSPRIPPPEPDPDDGLF